MRKLLPALLVSAGFTMMPISPARAQSAVMSSPSASTTDLVLNGEDWKLGSFEMDEGEKLQVYRPGFDDHSFRTVKVPGEVQLQIGLRGMDLYYQSKTLTLVNEKEWWYRKRFVVSKADEGGRAADD